MKIGIEFCDRKVGRDILTGNHPEILKCALSRYVLVCLQHVIPRCLSYISSNGLKSGNRVYQ
jgi:hypothetical protein